MVKSCSVVASAKPEVCEGDSFVPSPAAPGLLSDLGSRKLYGKP